MNQKESAQNVGMVVIVIGLIVVIVLMTYVLSVNANETVSYNSFCLGFSLGCV